jgi:hypothetical protein
MVGTTPTDFDSTRTPDAGPACCELVELSIAAFGLRPLVQEAGSSEPYRANDRLARVRLSGAGLLPRRPFDLTFSFTVASPHTPWSRYECEPV